MSKRWYSLSLGLVLVGMLAATAFFPARNVAIAAILAATMAWIVFCIAFQVEARWWEHNYGRNMMGQSFWMTVVLLLFSSGVLFPRWPGYEVAWYVTFANLFVLGIQRTYLMIQAQKEGHA